MTLQSLITKVIDLFYIPVVERFVPRQIFRYGACGAINMTLDAIWYFIFYHFVVAKQFVDLGFVVISPHILSLVLVFPITLLTGFWLNRNVVFGVTQFSCRGQLFRYALSVCGSILLNYLCIKLFVEVCHIWPTPAKALTTVVSVVYSYLAGRYFAFGEKNR